MSSSGSSAPSITSVGTMRPSAPPLPDMRLEQFFLSTVRPYVWIDGVSPESYVTATHTPWEKVYQVQWRKLAYALFWEQLVSPIWQGVLWGLGGVLVVCARQALVYKQTARVPAPPKPKGVVPFLSQLLARVGLGGLAI